MKKKGGAETGAARFQRLKKSEFWPRPSDVAAFGLPFVGAALVAGAVGIVATDSPRKAAPRRDFAVSANAAALVPASISEASSSNAGAAFADSPTEPSNAAFIETTSAQSFEEVGAQNDLTRRGATQDDRADDEKNAAAPAVSAPVVSDLAETQGAERDEETRRALNQLEFQFAEIQNSGAELPCAVNPALATLWEDAERLVATPTDDAKLAEQTESFLTRLRDFQRFIEKNAAFFEKLARFDSASVDADADAVRDLAAQIAADGAGNDAPEIAERRRELARAAAAFDEWKTVDDWNAFVEENGAKLERFYVAPDVAEIALKFLAQNKKRQGVPSEIAALRRRADEWKFAVDHRVAVRRKIVLALNAELETPYWTFAETPDKIYYLKKPPRPGRNAFVGDSLGTSKTVDVPSDAPETKSNESTQLAALQELTNAAQAVPESLRESDVGRWYADWRAFLCRLQSEKSLDPLVQFQLLKKTAETLAAGDYYFAKRLAPIVRMLDVPRLDSENVDRFDAQNVETQELRRLARTRVAFLPSPDDYLKVVKTTASLDRGVEKFAFQYWRVGWLDRTFGDVWRLRKPNDFALPVGDLYVLSAEEENVGDSTAPNAAPPRFHWLKIGFSDGRQATIQLAASNVWRGSIVFCRTRADAVTPVAERLENSRFFRR